MSIRFALTAIKTQNVDIVLETVAEFYKKHKLQLKEVGFDGNKSPYIDDVRYPTYVDYRNDPDALIYEQDSMYSKDFGLYYNLSENKDWLVILYNLKSAPHTLSLDINLAKSLCKKLESPVLEYLYDDGYDNEIIRFNDKNNAEDYSVRVLGKQNLAKGRLSDIEKSGTDSFFKEIGFNPYAEEIQDWRKPNQWRSFYLESSEQNLIKYLEDIQKEI